MNPSDPQIARALATPAYFCNSFTALGLGSDSPLTRISFGEIFTGSDVPRFSTAVIMRRQTAESFYKVLGDLLSGAASRDKIILSPPDGVTH